MTPERLSDINELYHAVREATASERAALLARADPVLRREVESLLSKGNAPEDATVTIVPIGTRLGPYRIESKLGEGGMGEVFRATDTRLGRTIAIKITRAQFGARFEREVRAISALNHPHICTLHDVGTNYLVMELVEGETLAAQLQNGPLPFQTALLYASQIAAALAEAHGKGIIHRDLKPANIMVGKSGVKVLDFGLARMTEDDTVTESRMIVGTPAYMAPEQREGKPADARSDIYAFGLILYEMTTGARMGAQPKPIRPRRLEKLIDRCLEQDPAKRWQSISELQTELAVKPRRRSPRVAVAAGAGLLVVAMTYYVLHRAPSIQAKNTIVLGDVENKTKDPIFDQTLRQGLAVQLQQSPFLALVSDTQIRQELGFMHQPAGAPLTGEISREVCERAGGSAVVDGAISGLGSQYVLWLRARDCRTGEVLAEAQAQPEQKESVLKTLSGLASQMRARLGESAVSLQQHSTPLEQATTSSLEALQAYSLAKAAIHARGTRAGIAQLQQAIVLDPQFAMAHADLGFMWSGLGQTDLGAEEVRLAYALRDRVSDREKRYILMLYDRQVTGNLQKELQTLESWAQAYPRDTYAQGIIAGWVSFGTANYERGVQAATKSIELDPSISAAYEALALHNVFLERYTQAADALKLAEDRKLESPDLLVIRYNLAFLNGDLAGMDREIARALREGAEDEISHNQALVLARSGRMRQARALWERAIALAQQAGNHGTAATYAAAAAVCEALTGNMAAASDRARAALTLGKGAEIQYAAAFALALSHGESDAQGIASGLKQRFPEDTAVQFEYLPVLRALSAISQRAPAKAVEQLQSALPYDLALPFTAMYGRFGALYPAYVRGQAYLAAGLGSEAAAEFQKILNHRGIVAADPVGVLAHLQLGRAYVAARETAKAKAAYQHFLALWKDADQDVPILIKAREEYAKL